MPQALTGRTIALAEGRQLEELAAMLEKEGAGIIRCPLISILDAPDEAPVLAWLRDLVADRFGYVVLMTGEGVRRLLSFADHIGLRADAIAALGRTRTVTRGPKPGQALKEIGLTPYKVASAPTTDGTIATLRAEPLHGQVVGVQLFGVPNPPLEQFLTEAGATVVTVMPYIYAPSTDSERVADLINRMSRGEVDAVVFTSTPQIERLYDVAVERKLEAVLAASWGKTKVAAVGPILAETLRSRGAPVDICPEQGFVMKNLVKHIKTALTTSEASSA